jgi:hypothetical protein
LPDQRSGFFVVNHLEGSTLRDELKETLLTRYYSRARQRLPVPARPLGFSQRIAEYTGRYGPTTSCHSCAPRSVPYVMTVSASPDSSGLLMSGKQWIEVERSLFVRQDGTGYIAFRRDAGGKVTEMFAGGFWSFERLP